MWSQNRAYFHDQNKEINLCHFWIDERTGEVDLDNIDKREMAALLKAISCGQDIFHEVTGKMEEE